MLQDKELEILKSVQPPGLPMIPFPALEKIDVFPLVRAFEGKTIKCRSWTFHYSDGTQFQTSDAEMAEQIARQFFPALYKKNI